MNLITGVTYYYWAFIYNTTLNYSSTAHTQATPVSLSITSLSPNRGSAGSSVGSRALGFGTAQRTSKVTWPKSQAVSITATVPPSATSGFVMVMVNGAQTNGVTFEVGGKTRCTWEASNFRLI